MATITEDYDYLIGKMNIANSSLDAKAIKILNNLSERISKLEQSKQELLDDLIEEVQSMREESNTDLRGLLYRLDKLKENTHGQN